MADVAALYRTARAAAPRVRALSLESRARKCASLRQVVLKRRDDIVDTLHRATGKVRTDALVSEVFSVLDFLRFLEKDGARLLRDRPVKTPLALLGKRSVIYYEPLGVVLVISPWNYPFYLGLVPVLSAFFAGNSVIYKPSEWTPLTGLLEALFEQSGIERDWIQVAYGDGALGTELVRGGPDKICFTGSTATGIKILQEAAPRLIPVTLELGGKDPMIVFDDASLDRAAAGAAWGAFTNAGQSCTSVERLYVQKGALDAFREKLVARVKRLRQKGDEDTGNDIGRITTAFQVEKIRRQVEEARARGGRLLTGESWDGKSDLIPPIVVEGAPEDCALLREETFGPVVPLIPFSTEEEVVRLANESPYGLSASVWTADRKRAERVTRALQVGAVSVNNVMLTEGNPHLPFGGVKASGFGRTKGEAGLHAFTNPKAVLYDKNSGKFEVNWFPYTREKYRLFVDMIAHLFQDGWLSVLRFAAAGLKLEHLSQRISRHGR